MDGMIAYNAVSYTMTVGVQYSIPVNELLVELLDPLGVVRWLH